MSHASLRSEEIRIVLLEMHPQKIMKLWTRGHRTEAWDKAYRLGTKHVYSHHVANEVALVKNVGFCQVWALAHFSPFYATNKVTE